MLLDEQTRKKLKDECQDLLKMTADTSHILMDYINDEYFDEKALKALRDDFELLRKQHNRVRSILDKMLAIAEQKRSLEKIAPSDESAGA